MGELSVKSSMLLARDRRGQFIAACHAGITAAVEESIILGAKIANADAPVGKQSGSRFGVSLRGSVHPYMLSSTSGTWGSSAPHAEFVLKGTPAHPISGKLNFDWASAGRRFTHWNPDYPWNYKPAVVKHPGTKPNNFMRRSYKEAGDHLMEALKRNIPG